MNGEGMSWTTIVRMIYLCLLEDLGGARFFRIGRPIVGWTDIIRCNIGSSANYKHLLQTQKQPGEIPMFRTFLAN